MSWRQRKSSWSQKSYSHLEENVDVEASAVHDDGEETDAENLGPEECSAEFFDFLVHLKMHGNPSAKDVCILNCWARGARVQGKGVSLAVKPSRTRGSFSEKFDAVLGLTEAIQSDFCCVPVPGMPRSTLDRNTAPCHGAHVYEDLAKEIVETPGSRSACTTKFWQETGDHNVESTLSYKPKNLGNSRFPSRSTSMACHSNAGIRSLVTGSSTCSRVGGTCSSKCGRRTCVGVVAKVGAISTPSGHTTVGWSMRSTRAATRDNVTPWNPGERVTDSEDWRRRSDHGQGGLGGVRGDILVPDLGPPRDPLFSLRCKWWARRYVSRDRKTFEMYDAACRACESHVHLRTADDLQLFFGHVLASRRRERGGQITTTDIPALGIAKNLRVESPPTSCSSLKLEEFAARFPPAGVHITLWNPSAETLARPRNPLFGIDLCPAYLLPDELHTVHLWVFQIFVHTALSDIIIFDVWRASLSMGVQESDANGDLRLEYELSQCYKKE